MSFTHSLCRIFSLRLSQYRQYVCFHGKSTLIRANKILPQSSQKKFVIVLVFSVSYGSFVYGPPPFSWIRDRDCQRQLWMVVAMWFLFTLCPSNCNIQYAYLNSVAAEVATEEVWLPREVHNNDRGTTYRNDGDC